MLQNAATLKNRLSLEHVVHILFSSSSLLMVKLLRGGGVVTDVLGFYFTAFFEV